MKEYEYDLTHFIRRLDERFESLMEMNRRSMTLWEDLARRLERIEERREFLPFKGAVSLEYVTKLETSISDLKNGFNSLRDRQKHHSNELHAYLAAQLLGLDLNDMPLHRFLPIRVYLTKADKQQISQVSKAMNNFAKAFGFEISDDFPAETGSWWKRWFVKTREVISQPELTNRLEKIERALELKGLHKPQSDVDKNEAEATATLIKALENTPNAAIQVGTLLIVKGEDNSGKAYVQSRTLSPDEMICLEKNRHLFSAPQEILKNLEALSQKKAHNVLPAEQT